MLWYDNTNIRVPASYQTDLLTSVDIAKLLIVYHALYPEERNIDIGDHHFTIKKFSTIFVRAEKFGSKTESRTLRSAKLLASWHSAEGLISATSPLSPGIIDYFMCHKLTVNGTESIILLVFSGSRSILGTNAWEVLIPFMCGRQITLNLEHRATFCLFIGYTVFLLELI